MTQAQYTWRLLQAYRALPGTCGRVRPADRRLARQLFCDGVPLDLILVAFQLALARRTIDPDNPPPRPPIRSLHYFLPVLDEARFLPDGYRDYLLARTAETDDRRQLAGDLR